jgi:hypothetical protein
VPRRSFAITRPGHRAPIGVAVEQFWQGAIEGWSGIRELSHTTVGAGHGSSYCRRGQRPQRRLVDGRRVRPEGRRAGWHTNDSTYLSTMKVVCAWCLREGRPGDLGEREPLEDLEVTHSICAGHRNHLLEGLPSRSFPDTAVLIIVRPNDTALFESLHGLFTGVPDAKVIVDRRTNDRRSAQDPVSDDRRRVSTRRLRQGRTVGGCTVVRFTPAVQSYV